MKFKSFKYTVESAKPNLAFDDGKHLNIVAVGEVWAPAWTDVADGLPRSTASNDFYLIEAAVLAMRWMLWRVIFKDHDKRWRLLVHRTSRRSRKWRVVRVEFFERASEAKARQAEIMRDWRNCVRQYGWDDAPGITSSERRDMRKASRVDARKK